MKFTKMSLVAALLIGSSAFALENVKVSGDANLYYNTTDGASGYDAVKGRTSGTLFSKDSSAADVAVNLNVSADLVKNDLVSISAGAGYTVLTTLGLENNLVSNVWGGSHTATAPTGANYGKALGGAKVENASWMKEAWVATTAGKTTAKLGRMALDTPLAFTETWTAEENTFEGAVLINQDIPDTTLVGAYIGNGNGTETFGQNAQSAVQKTYNLAVAPVVNANGKFTTYGANGAYAAGVINNSWKPLTAQAWYYDVTQVATAYWLQADLDASSLGVDGLTFGAQYSGVTAAASGSKEDNVYAVKLGYGMKDLFAASVAYSQTNDNGSIGYAGFNTATSTGTAQSKLYTEAWWNYGYVTRTDTQAYNVTVTSPVNGLVDLGAYYTNADHNAANDAGDLQEITLTASKSFGPLDTTLAYINSTVGNGDNTNSVQVYAKLNF
ncbi:hypothetical protein [Sulfurimonas sp.]|uniref:hypothetical protein n=1 Tax=Sulfurimonas sp. TaxID=2022749 RepID=UPI0026160604|nr:hypothetical protein [Sulfurimonas sp.]